MKVRRIVGISNEDFDRLPKEEQEKHIEWFDYTPEELDCSIEEYARRNGFVPFNEFLQILDNVKENAEQKTNPNNREIQTSS